MARALTGDAQGAIDDFESVVGSIKSKPDREGYSQAFVDRRESWIRALRAGQSPFDAKLLETLRVEDPEAEVPEGDQQP